LALLFLSPPVQILENVAAKKELEPQWEPCNKNLEAKLFIKALPLSNNDII